MNLTEKRTTADHLAQAMNSHDLSAGHDVDYLTALGMTGARNSRASSVFRLVNSLDSASYQSALEETIRLVRRLNTAHRWRMQAKAQNELAKQALDYFVCPVCPACKGRRYVLIKGTPNLSPVICKVCGGTGLKKPEDRNLRDRILLIASELDRCIGFIVGGVRKRIHGLTSSPP